VYKGFRTWFKCVRNCCWLFSSSQVIGCWEALVFCTSYETMELMFQKFDVKSPVLQIIHTTDWITPVSSARGRNEERLRWYHLNSQCSYIHSRDILRSEFLPTQHLSASVGSGCPTNRLWCGRFRVYLWNQFPSSFRQPRWSWTWPVCRRLPCIYTVQDLQQTVQSRWNGPSCKLLSHGRGFFFLFLSYHFIVVL